MVVSKYVVIGAFIKRTLTPNVWWFMPGEKKNPSGLYERDNVFFHTMMIFFYYATQTLLIEVGAEPSFLNEYSHFWPNIGLNFQTCLHDVLIWIYVYIQPESWNTPYSNNDASVYYFNINTLNDDTKWRTLNLSVKGFKADLKLHIIFPFLLILSVY